MKPHPISSSQVPSHLPYIYTRSNSKKGPLIKADHNFLNNKHFSSAIIEWNKLDPIICDSLPYPIIKKQISEFIRPPKVSNVSSSIVSIAMLPSTLAAPLV